MKTFLILLFVGFALALPYGGWAEEDNTLEARVSYFYPFSKRLRELYGNGWANYTVEATQTFCNEWTLWGGVSGWPVTGHSTCLHNKSRMSLVSLSLGMQRQLCITSCLQYYLGVGALYNFLKIHDKSCYVHKHFSKNGIGAVAKMGCYYFFNPCWFLDLNFEYLYQEFHFSHHRHSRVPRRDLNLNGFQVGAGIGMEF